jgi:hypothetical protein
MNSALPGSGDSLILVGAYFPRAWYGRSKPAKDDEEKTSSLRATYLYGALMATLVPVVQNILALVDRLLLGAGRLSMERALIGGGQTLSDNLIAISMNLLIAVYFWNVLRNDWRSLPELGNFKDVFRLYRHLWCFTACLWSSLVQQVFAMFFMCPQTIGVIGRETLVNGMALLVLGTPIWFYVCNLPISIVDVENSPSFAWVFTIN